MRVGFGPEGRMAREQVTRAQREIEDTLAKLTGAPCALAIESVSAEQAKSSLAEQARSQREEREERQKRACQENEAVGLVQQILRARVAHIELVEVVDTDFSQADFAADDTQEQ